MATSAFAAKPRGSKRPTMTRTRRMVSIEKQGGGGTTNEDEEKDFILLLVCVDTRKRGQRRTPKRVTRAVVTDFNVVWALSKDTDRDDQR